MGLKPRSPPRVDLEYRPGRVSIWLGTAPCHPDGGPVYFDSDNSESSPRGPLPLPEALAGLSFSSSYLRAATAAGEAAGVATTDWVYAVYDHALELAAGPCGEGVFLGTFDYSTNPKDADVDAELALQASSSLRSLVAGELRQNQLSIWNEPIGDAGAELIASCEHLARVESLTLNNTKMTAAGYGAVFASPYLTKLRELEIYDSLGDEIAALLATTPALRLSRLRPTLRRLSSAGFANLIAAPVCADLETLELHPTLDDAALEALAAAPVRLRQLALQQSSGYSDAGLAAYLESPAAAELRGLALPSGAGPKTFRAIGKNGDLDRLEMLSVRYAKGTSALASWRDADHLGALAELRFDSTQVGDGGLASLAASPLASLRHLHLHRARAGDAGLAAIADSPSMARLEVLDLRGNPAITSDTLIALAGSPHLAALTTLRLAESAVADRGLEALAGAAAFRLETFDLGDTQVGDMGAVALAGSVHAATLADLRLTNTGVTDAGAVALVSSSAILSKLTALYVDRTQAGDQTAEALAANPAAGDLEDLSFRFTPLTATGVRALIDSPHLSQHLCLNLWGVSMPRELRQAAGDRFDAVIAEP